MNTLVNTGIGVALGFIVYKLISKVLADQGIYEAEESLMAIGSKIKYTCCCSDGSQYQIRGNMSCPCGVDGHGAYEVPCRNYNLGASF